MEHLSLEQSLKIRKLEFPQKVEKGDWYYSKSASGAWKTEPSLMHRGDPGLHLPQYYVICPNLEKLIASFEGRGDSYLTINQVLPEVWWVDLLENHTTLRARGEGKTALQAVYDLFIKDTEVK